MLRLQLLMLLGSLATLVAGSTDLLQSCDTQRCYSFDSSDVKSKPAVHITTPTPEPQPTEGFRLKVIDDHSWELHLKYNAHITECKFTIGICTFSCQNTEETIGTGKVKIFHRASDETYALSSTESLPRLCLQEFSNKQVMQLSGEIGDKEVVFANDGSDNIFDFGQSIHSNSIRSTPYDSTIETCDEDNACFAFGRSFSPPKPDHMLYKMNRKEDFPSQQIMLGVFIKYNEKEWIMRVIHERTYELESFEIGKCSFKFGQNYKITGHVEPQSKAEVHAMVLSYVEVGPKQIRSTKFQLYTSVENVIMAGCGFYNDAKDEIKLMSKKGSDPLTQVGTGVAKHLRYKADLTKPLAYDSSVRALLQPDSSNFFSCTAQDEFIFLGDENTKAKELRYTPLGWLAKDGKVKVVLVKGKVPQVRCYSLCKKELFSSQGSNKPEQVGSGNVNAYKCEDSAVLINKKYYDAMTCSNNEWKGDTDVIKLEVNNILFKAECFGAFSFVKDCATDDKGCGKLKRTKDTLTCDPGYVLTLSGAVHKSLSVKKGKWFSEDTDLNKVADLTEPPHCYSKCSPAYVIHPPASTSEHFDRATYSWISGPTGTLKCSASDVLIVKFDGETEDTLYYKDLTCDPTKGWMEGGTVKKSLATVTSEAELKVSARCYKVCENRVNPNSCGSFALSQNDAICQEVAISSTYTCGNKHVMRYKGNDNTVKELFKGATLTCDRYGFKNGANTIFSHDPKQTIFNVACIPNCAMEFTLPSTNSIRPTYRDPLKCQDNEILVIDSKIRVFEALKCEPAIGWKIGSSSKPIDDSLDFSKGVNKFTASCETVCSSNQITEMCVDGALDCTRHRHYDSAKLECDLHHKLVLDGKESDKANEMTCKNTGWYAAGAVMIDFVKVDKGVYPVDITKKLGAICKHKCHIDFVDLTKAKDGCPTCSTAKYENRKLTCTDDTEILVITHESIPKESFNGAECGDDGWKTIGTQPQELFKLDGFAYKISARCEQLCVDPVTYLNDADTKMSRSFDPATKTLTCTAREEMLALSTLTPSGLYSDMTCKKEGWKNEGDDFIHKFTPNPVARDADRMPKFECIPNDCWRAKTSDSSVCSDENSEKNLCTKLDESKKYQLSCPDPMKIMRGRDSGVTTPLSHKTLICKNGEWFVPETTTVFLPKDEDFDLMCSADQCANCDPWNADHDLSSADGFISKATYNKGNFRYCAGYICRNSHYKIASGATYKYYYNDPQHEERIECQGSDEYNTPKVIGDTNGRNLDKTAIAGPVGCIKQIPCDEHSPLDLTCPETNPDCDDTLKDKLARGSRKAMEPIKCKKPYELYYKKPSGGKWILLKHLQCDERGEWIGERPAPQQPSSASTSTGIFPLKTKVVCALHDPNGPPAPENPLKDTCNPKFCKLPEEKSCGNCESLKDNFKKVPDGNGTCTATADYGQFVFKDDNGEWEAKEMTCQVNEEGIYKWTAAGRVVQSVGGVKADPKFKWWIIVIIALVAIAAIGIVVFIFILRRIKKKREVARQESLVSKGLEQKMDSIIDHVSVEDPKTVIL